MAGSEERATVRETPRDPQISDYESPSMFAFTSNGNHLRPLMELARVPLAQWQPTARAAAWINLGSPRLWAIVRPA